MTQESQPLGARGIKPTEAHLIIRDDTLHAIVLGNSYVGAFADFVLSTLEKEDLLQEHTWSKVRINRKGIE